MTYSQGDLIGIPFPFSDMSTKKNRPVLVITTPDQRGDFMCLAITSVPTVQDAISIDNTIMASGTLPKKSWIRYDKLFTLNTSAVIKCYGSIAEKIFRQVVGELCKFIGCNEI